ncbi:MAG TPA: phosphate ABC transporter substrate-binding protein PstS [Actinophytocola sp.]|nr:phosphate ABC transporter substrate-binding protein PstS [Actinophytocola sp.]
MKRIRYGRIAALVAAGALVLTACGNDPVVAGGDSGGNGGGSEETSLSGELAGAGASSQEAAMQAWIAGFGAANPEAIVTYDAVGSGAGRTQFGEGAVAFAGSDSVMDDEERATAKERCGGTDAIHLPLYISPIAVVYNLEGVEDLQLSPATLAGIFNREITNWDDQAIKADNPGVTLPNKRIIPVNRSDESGTTENFTEYLAAAAVEAWPHEPSGDWPLQGGQSAQGTSGLVQTVQGGDGTIGYADASKAGNLGVAKIKVGDSYVEASSEAAAKVVDESPRLEGVPEGDLAIDLKRDTTAEGTYPIVLVSYLIVCKSYEDAAQGDLVKGFVSYVASEEGQAQAEQAAGSAPISDTLRSEVEASIESIAVGS